MFLRLALLLLAAPVYPPAQAMGERVPATVPGTRGEALAEFLALLERLRQGGEPVARRLVEVADRLCREHGRCDAGEIARWFLSLSPEGRCTGWEDELAWRALWAKARKVTGDGTASADSGLWRRKRESLVAELHAFAEEVLPREDPLPAAHALSLAARLTAHHLERTRTEDGHPLSRESQLRRAESDALQATQLFRASGMVTPRLEPLWVRGRLAHLHGREVEARAWFERCLALAKSVDSTDYRERALLGLAALARTAGNTLEAQRILDELSTFRDPARCWPLAREWATGQLQRDRPARARAFLLGHRPAAQSNAADWGAWHLLMSSCALRSGDLTAAREHLDQIENGTPDGVLSESRTLARATLELAEGCPDRVLAILDAELQATRPSARGRATAHGLRGEAWLDLGEPLAAASELEAALDLARVWSREHGQADPGAGGSIVGEWLGLHAVALLARARLELDQPLLAALAIEQAQSASLRTRAPALTTDDLLAWAGATDLGLVTWVLGANGGVAVHISPAGSAEGRRVLHGRRSVEEAVRRLRRAALEGITNLRHTLGAQLRDELLPDSALRSMEEAPPQAGQRMLFLLHGPLEALPLALIPLGDRPLDDRVTPLVLPGLPHPAPGLAGPAGSAVRAPAPAMPWTLAGDPLIGLAEPQPLLPGAAEELSMLASERPAARVARGEGFTRAALADALTGTGALHVATHLVTDSACRSDRLAAVGLGLSHGDLFCVDDLAALRPRLSLVFLGACGTADGRSVDAEGLQGLARVFLDSGTRNLLATLWPVEDGAARDFALAFHRALAAGAAPSEAARRARNALRDRGAGAADWAAFRLLGRD